MTPSPARSVFALLIVGTIASACGRPPETPKNLLILCLDTVRFDHLRHRGYARDTTPAMDRLAKRGLSFSRARSTSNWTVPAVASLLTGLYPARHGAGVPGAFKNLDSDEPPLQFAADTATLAGHLRGRGFDTAMFSANPFLYDRFKGGFTTARVERLPASQVVDEALSWLEQRGSKPWFLYLHFMDAHHPNTPPREYAERFDPAIADRLERYGQWDFARLETPSDPAFLEFRSRRIAAYDASIRYLDAELDRLLSSIEAAGRAESTLIVLTADHGEEFWDHSAPESRHTDDPRQIWGIGHGHTFYEELVRVPLLLVGPQVARGAQSECPASLVDIVPTVLAALDVEPLGGLDGFDLLDAPATCRGRAVFSSSPAYGSDATAVELDRWKLIARAGQLPRLFNLADDPRELNDLAKKHEAITAKLLELVRAYERGMIAGSESAAFDEATRRQLRALGYL